MLNYLDRGIIPGAPQSFRHFITTSLGVAVTGQSLYFGLLSSAFIIGHSVLSIAFGYFALTCRPFRIIALGTSIWIIAIVICGISEHVNSYALLIVGRVLSGAGEASFQCVAPPFIDRHAPPERGSLYVGIYLASVFVGEAIGFVYGSVFADSSLTWAGGYYLEAILMVILVCCCLFCVPDELNVVSSKDDVAVRKSLVSVQELLNSNGLEQYVTSVVPSPVKKEPFFHAWWDVLSNFPFLLFVLGNGAYTFTLGVYNTYGPDLFVGLGLFTDETSASLVFGIIVAVGGLIGTPFGGWFLDRQTNDTSVAGKRCFIAIMSIFVYVTVAEVFILIMCFLGGSKGLSSCASPSGSSACARYGDLKWWRSSNCSRSHASRWRFQRTPSLSTSSATCRRRPSWASCGTPGRRIAVPSKETTPTPTSIHCVARTRMDSRTSCCYRRYGWSGPCCCGVWPPSPSREDRTKAASYSRPQSIKEDNNVLHPRP